MSAIIAIILTGLLEQRACRNVLAKLRSTFVDSLQLYADYFTDRNVITPMSLWLISVLACAPIIIVLSILALPLAKHHLLYLLVDVAVFILSVQIFTWKEEAKLEKSADKRLFISTYALRFFAPLFWFLVLPLGMGAVCYLLVTFISNDLKARHLDDLMYSVVADRVLFCINIIPYILLFLFIALAGNFEEVMYFIVAERKKFRLSYYYLENLLHAIVLVAVGREKFAVASDIDYDSDGKIAYPDTANISDEHFNLQITPYIVAILYRAGVFFIGIITLITITNLF